MKYREHCFLCYPEWQKLLSQTSSWSFQSSQPASLSLRTQLATTLVNFPSLMIGCSAIFESHTYPTRGEAPLDILIDRALSMLTDVNHWLQAKAEPHFTPNTIAPFTSPNYYGTEHIKYPDLLIGVLDCVANTAILAIEELLRRLYLARLHPYGSAIGSNWPKDPGLPWLSDDPERMRQHHQRAISALDFVKAESTLAAKPLEFGLQQVQSGGFSLRG